MFTATLMNIVHKVQLKDSFKIKNDVISYRFLDIKTFSYPVPH